MNLHSNKLRIRIGFISTALALGAILLYYTNQLVDKLAEREQRSIDLYAKGLEFVANSDNSSNLTFLFQEIIQAKNSVPVILTDSQHRPLSHKNIEIPEKASKKEEQAILREELQEMKKAYLPIEVHYGPGLSNYIYYKNSFLITQLRYYPIAQFGVFLILATLAYLSFNYSKNAEQNRVWVGMAKETAHQLGTPLSSLMAWIELFKLDPRFDQDDTIVELEKDVKRLEMITARFSNIGSVPHLTRTNIADSLQITMTYLQRRLSTKVQYSCTDQTKGQAWAMVNVPLLDWAIENLCKNAIDAMNGVGRLDLTIGKTPKGVFIDITDTGKGISKKQIDQVFNPGFTTKTRGWGLGLTLTKRIIENYHQGKVWVKSSEVGKGTTFRVFLQEAGVTSLS